MPPSPIDLAVAVFGSSEPNRDSDEYRTAEEVGRLLAASGYVVVNGGYGGVMEASARGARQEGGRVIGVTSRAFRSRRAPNPFLDQECQEEDLFDRTRRLIETASAFIVLPGKSGTLAELAFLFALRRSDLLGNKPIALLGTVWRDLIDHLRQRNLVGEVELATCRVVGTPREAVDCVALGLKPPAPL